MKVPEAVVPYLQDQLSARNHVVVLEVKEISNTSTSSYDDKNCEIDPDASVSPAQEDKDRAVSQDDNETDGNSSDDHSQS